MEQTEKLVTFNPISWVAWILALPIRFIAWIIATVRSRMYDPEQIVCPACGFRGDSGTANKTCRISCVRTSGPEKAAIEHSCFRCNAKFYSKLFSQAQGWMPPLDENRAAMIQKAAAREEL